MWIVEPLAGTKLAAFAAVFGIMPIGEGFCHWLLPQCKLAKARSGLLFLRCAKSPALQTLAVAVAHRHFVNSTLVHDG
jgi:hypothetical protein